MIDSPKILVGIVGVRSGYDKVVRQTGRFGSGTYLSKYPGMTLSTLSGGMTLPGYGKPVTGSWMMMGVGRFNSSEKSPPRMHSLSRESIKQSRWSWPHETLRNCQRRKSYRDE